MSTSGTYTFLTSEIDELIYEAFSRVPVPFQNINATEIQQAKRSMNLSLVSWMNKKLNLWTIKRDMIGLNAGQSVYTLPDYTSDVLDATIRTSNRMLGGTAYSSAGGTASYAFDANSSTSCTQTSADGYISYTWDTNKTIALVGVQSNTTSAYTLVFEYSNDNATWVQVGSADSQTYTASTIVWCTVSVPTSSTYFRVRETGGLTLSVQELYFNTSVNDSVLTRMSGAQYDRLPQKNSPGKPNQYYVDRQTTPCIYLYPAPTSQYNALFISRKKMMQDVGSMINVADIPSRFLEAICAETAFRLAVKFSQDLDRIQLLKSLSDEQFSLASTEDSERVSLYIYPNHWAQI